MTKVSPLLVALAAAAVGSADAFVATGSFPRCSTTTTTIARTIPTTSTSLQGKETSLLEMFFSIFHKDETELHPTPLVAKDVDVAIQVIDDYMQQHQPKEALQLVRGLYIAAPELVAGNEKLYELAVQGTCELADCVQFKGKVLQQGIELADRGLNGIFANDEILVKTKEEMNAKLSALSP